MHEQKSFHATSPVHSESQWNDVLRDVCGPFDSDFRDRGRVRGHIGVKRMGPADIAHIACNARRITKRRAHLGQSSSDYYFLVFQKGGQARLAQNGLEAHLRPGDLTLIDSRYPSRFSYDETNEQLSLHLPLPLVSDWMGTDRVPCATPIRGDTGLGAMLAGHVQACHRLGDTMNPAEQKVAFDMVFRLLEGVVSGRDAEGAAGRRGAVVGGRHLERIAAYVQERLSDPDLTVDRIAAENNMSRRQLYRLFEETGMSPAGWLWQQRLNRARAMLCDPAMSDRSLTVVAFDCGFSDAAHFSRAFKARFGATPSAFRQARLTRSA
ncbi:transcriptional regulator FeaR [Yunchengibacter salinarum]|uniref:transcriptional regulator FeaR n=1 Tax=Yunchengibacter salinarum TaxID=3133399 RepID=UPI0035B68C76